MIKSLRLKNFKCFEDQRFPLGNLTLLIGLNGTGKSSVIQSLLLLRQSYQQRFLQTKQLLLNGDLIQLGKAEDIVRQGTSPTDCFGFDLEFSSTKQPVVWNFDSAGRDRARVEVPTLIEGPSSSSEVYQTSLFEDNFHYLPADRIGPQLVFEGSPYFVGKRKQLGAKGKYTPHFLSELGDERLNNEDPRYHELAASNSLKDQVIAWMGEISPSVDIEIQDYPGINQVDLRYTFPYGGGNRRSTPMTSINVGFGITHTLPIVVALLASDKDALVLLENPENNLHEVGQIRLGELMALAASRGIQVIAETHSTNIREGIRQVMRQPQRIIAPNKIKEHSLTRQPGSGISEIAPLDSALRS